MQVCNFIWSSFFMAFCIHGVLAQDLSPRAYLITPVHSNALIFTYGFYNGSVQFNGAIPITGGSGRYSASAATLYHSLSIFGRSANITVSLPYAIGKFQGDLSGQHEQIYRSGLVDATLRLSVNLIGGPSMQASDFVKWRQKSLLGASIKVVAPTGQYVPTRLINWGINRWAFKPELGYSYRWNRWVLDTYAGGWFYTNNPQSYASPVPALQSQAPVGSLETHFSYDVKPRFWLSLDGNFWYGGTATLNGVANPGTLQTSSRIGATASLPLRTHQSLKFSYNDGLYIKYGGNYQSLTVAWQYSWLGRPQ
jgi:hypothetical protein